MVPFRFKHVRIQSTAVNLPELELTSAEIEDRVAPLYQRLEIPFGTLEKLSGVKSRRLWKRDMMPSIAATAAAKLAIEKSGFSKDQIKAVFNCSVTRDFFEPATACLVHRNLGLPEQATALDVSNACIGFSNGLMLLGSLIEAGVVKAGVVVAAETITPIIENTIEHLIKDETIQRDALLKILPTFTLGCGAAAYVLCHESVSNTGPKILGSVMRSATEHSELCAGNADYQLFNNSTVSPLMYTDSAKLMAAAAKLGGRMLPDFTASFGWKKEDINHIFCHQVGKQVNDAFYKEMGLEIEKEFTIYKNLGNLVSAALPTALSIGSEQKQMKKGEKILLTGFGSGLNSIFTAIEW